MDSLSKLHVAASGLLSQVDATLTRHGAPAEHGIWPLLRRRGLLPGDAVANVVAWEPGALLDRAVLLRSQRKRCVAVDGLLRGQSGWEGVAGEVFEARLRAARDEHDTFTGSTQTLADYLEDLADWISRGRSGVAQRLAAVLTSAQTVALMVDAEPGPAAPSLRARAAADIGVELLSEVDRFWVGAVELSDGWCARLKTDVLVSAPTPAAQTPAALRVDL